MSRAGYADFFPAAPSVLAKKAQAEKAAKERERARLAQAAAEQDADQSGALSAASSSSSSSSTATSTGSATTSSHAPAAHSNLTPSTSHSSPPLQLSPVVDSKVALTMPPAKDPPAPPPSLITPKATPPAAPPKPTERNIKITYDPTLASPEVRQKKGKHPRYRTNGEGVTEPIEDPRKKISGYPKREGQKTKVLLHNLGRARWQWDEHYIGPGPPSQILVTRLSPLITEAEVHAHFRSFGEIQALNMKLDPATGGSLGFCSIQFKDNKKILGHQAAKEAVKRAAAPSGMKIGSEKIRVELDRDGLKCSKIFDHAVRARHRKEEEERRKREREAAKNKPVPNGPKAAETSYRTHGILPAGQQGSPMRDHDNRFSKPRPAQYCALDEVGGRPTAFISKTYIPPDRRFIKHLYGRLRNSGVSEILMDSTGFYVVFLERMGMERCYRLCHNEPLFNYKMHMEPMPHGNRKSPAPPPRPQRPAESPPRPRSPDPATLPRIEPIKEAANSLLKDLKVAVFSDVRKRLADTRIFDLLDPGRLAKRRKIEARPQPEKIDTSVGVVISALESPASAALPSAPIKPNISALPKFKRRPRRVEPPKPTEDARPLSHMLNQYAVDASDDESTDRPTPRGWDSRAMSTEDDAVSVGAPTSRKRKRTTRGPTPSRLKNDASVSTDDEGDAHNRIDAGHEMQDFIVDSEDEEPVRKRKSKTKSRSKRAEEVIFTPSASEDEKPLEPRRKKILVDEDEIVDIVNIEAKEPVLPEPEVIPSEDHASVPAIKDVPAPMPTPMDLDDEPPAKEAESTVPIDYSWTVSTTGRPQVTVEDDEDIILDIDGLQDLVKDDEDFRVLRKALEGVEKENVGHPHAWAYRLKEVKAANRAGQRGVIRSFEKIEGFYRPSVTGCVRTDGYRKIPETEKSLYLPHRLAVAAKRANMEQTSPTSTKTTTKQVSSSRSNRVNNRRLVAELNNQKAILCADADVMRFNQLKKRKKPVKFARSAIHGWGLYAMEPISANDMIIEYVGEKVRQQVADLREKKYLKSGIGSSYLFRIDENTVIDATKRGGIARFINHSCTPNCTAKIIKVEGSKRIVIYALRDIKQNEELTYDYKFERELDSDERIPCLCGSSGCKGFLN